MRFRISTIALAVAAALPSLAAAVDFSYSGFSTAAYAQSDTDDAQVGYTGQRNGIDSDGTFAIDSKLGVQVTAKFNDMLSATVQGVAYADLTGDWEPHVDWAYVRFPNERHLLIAAISNLEATRILDCQPKAPRRRGRPPSWQADRPFALGEATHTA